MALARYPAPDTCAALVAASTAGVDLMAVVAGATLKMAMVQGTSTMVVAWDSMWSYPECMCCHNTSMALMMAQTRHQLMDLPWCMTFL